MAFSPEVLRATSNSMLEKLITVDEAKELLAPTEGLTEYEFATDGDINKVRFNIPDNWNAGLENEGDFFVIPDASIDIDGTELPLTKTGALALTSEVGLSKASSLDTPGSIVQDYVNYHYSHGARGKKSLKLLASDIGGLSVTRGTITPFSGAQLLDAIVAGIGTRYSTDDLRIDYKWNHGLQLTNLRLIVPSATRNIASARTDRAGDDPWSLGIELNNSVEGKSPLELHGYLFAWWCTNGCTTEHASSGKYRRKPSLSVDAAYDWAEHVVEDVLRDLEREFDAVEHLTSVPLDFDTNELGSLFERFEVPDAQRSVIIDNLVESDDFTAYGLLNATTAAANESGLSSATVNRLLTVGGKMTHSLGSFCETCHRF